MFVLDSRGIYTDTGRSVTLAAPLRFTEGTPAIEYPDGHVMVIGEPTTDKSMLMRFDPKNLRLVGRTVYKEKIHDMRRLDTPGKDFALGGSLKVQPELGDAHWDATIYETDATGKKVLYQKTFGDEGTDYTGRILPLKGGAYIATVNYSSDLKGKVSAKIIRFKAGTQIWSRELAPTHAQHISVANLWPLRDGDFIALSVEVIQTPNSPEKSTITLHRIAADGRTIQSRSYDKSKPGSNIHIFDFIETNNGDHIFLGIDFSRSKRAESFLIRTRLEAE
jgi:hypothetical protein